MRAGARRRPSFRKPQTSHSVSKIFPLFPYLRLNLIGTTSLTSTAFPLCVPGVQSGIAATTLTASASSSGCAELSTSTLSTLPALFTM